MSESITARATSESTTEDHEFFILPEEHFLDLMRYCIESKAREESRGPLKYTDCVAIKEILEGAPRAARQVLILGAFGNAYIKEVNGIRQIVLKGYAGNRGALAWLARMSHLTATHYGVNNPKVEMFEVKPLPEMVGELAKETRKSVRFAFYLWVGLDVVEELFFQDHWYLSRLGVHLASDMLKTVLAAAAGMLAGVAIAGVIVFFFPACAVAGVVAALGMFAVSVASGFGLEALDKKLGLTTRLEEVMMEYEDRLKERAGEKIDYWHSLLDRFERDVEFTLNALRAAREGAAKAKEYWDRTEKFLRGIPELGDFVFRLP
jgi:hypothetical protein